MAVLGMSSVRRTDVDRSVPLYSGVEEERLPALRELGRFPIPLLQQRRKRARLNSEPDLVRAR
jgi:hypothetical protein